MKTNTKTTPAIYRVEDDAQRKALTSPIRLEIIGHFTSPEPLSVAEIGARMGRPPTAIYYHIHQLEEVGLLVRAGSRGSGKKVEVLYRPVAEHFDLTPDRGNREHDADALATLKSAHRMAARDMEAALRNGTGRYEGERRNFTASRMHARLDAESLEQANAHIDALYEIFMRESMADNGDGDFCSLTITLMPLRGRQGSE
ncbi:MAG: helix-turn-helix transcriptional regulator [Gemmatimonadetes bacterium]|nr:helix-turn-helix transcriptional regulator [Gemmatimonadota bacterium]